MPDRSSLEQTVALLEATLDASQDGVLVLDLDRRVVRHNAQLLKMFRLPSEIVRGGVAPMIGEIGPQLENPDEAQKIARAVRADVEMETVDVLRFRDGRVFEVFVAPLRVGDRIVGRIAAFRDISQSARTEQALEQNRAFLEKAQEVAHIGSWVAELDGSERLGWSVEAHRIFAVPVGEFEGTSSSFFARVHPADRDAVRAAAAAAIAGERTYDTDHRIVRSDGTVRWVHEKADILRDADGRAVRMIGTVQDVTDRRLLEDQLRQSQKMEAIGRLAGGIAHDLNNALTAIAGYSELALGQLETTHPARPDVEEIRRATERAGSVTRQLLAFSRKELLEPRLFDLNHTVGALGRLLARLLGADIDVRTELAPSLPPILGDPGQLEQAIINLAVNARDAMPTGGRFTLATSVEDLDDRTARANAPMSPGRYVVLRASDTGHGMSPDTMARVFEPFFTTKETGKGTGLGLSMVYGTLKQIGGFIFADSEIGHGTTFRLYFPPAAAPLRVENAPAEAKAPLGRTETLLVVEDEPAVRNLVASALRADGYNLLLAGSAEEALRVAGEYSDPIDLLLTDAIMPGQSGVELANLLVAGRPTLRVIVMSGYTEETLSGFDPRIALLQKPFAPRELRRRIREALGHVGESSR